jgi:hypothetical protein
VAEVLPAGGAIMKNKQVLLARRPHGAVVEDDFESS